MFFKYFLLVFVVFRFLAYVGFWLILTEFDFKNVSKYMSTHASVHFLLFTLNVAYDALLCTLPLSPVSVRSHTAGYRGLPMPLHSTAWLRHGLFTQSRIEEHLDWALTLLSPYSFLETFFCSELQYIPLSWLSCCFPDYSIICSLPSAHTLNLTVPMPCAPLFSDRKSVV